ncbi:cysteine synthase A [Myroides odoratimimus]|uniref:cysteine synthase n=2 Tax=Myroides odoratimimus TaxID=76832 RepID=A0A0S7EK55_9FLAO|nr:MULTISPECIES: cysteine synthase A [Myroides]AJA70777.1 cysteine synthase A [Myroides sp. A21]ALU27641.1 cysteine synthase [Myroides odoratimimus]APA93982.1 cysteine synthase A [Myroides sp. ZB35]EHO07456.1 cysteine synthase A [Myroides odoratimimus CCUG 12901]EHO09695.1 cysteine synthase A [Myroides odoratimimus CCUG 10230]
MKINSVLEAIGNTPHIKINKLFPNDINVWIKLEKQNPGGSLKDRIALAMIEDAEAKGLINKDTTIIEPTSGNTGVGLAMTCAVKGYKLILVMPESMSIERRKLMAAYGAKFVLTPKELGTSGSVSKATELAEEMENAWVPQQFNNLANPEVHRKTTALEIINDFPEGIDYLITGVGTGGHITGVAEELKKVFPKLKVFAVEPENSPVLSGGKPGPHPLQGIGAGFIPKVVNTDIFDGIITIGKEEAYAYTNKIASQEGILAGISTGTSLAAIAKKLPEIEKGATILTFNYDTGERYWSVSELFDEKAAEIK